MNNDFEHPGHRFVELHGLPSKPCELGNYICDYAAFLRQEANTQNSIPVNTDSIIKRFSIAKIDGEGLDNIAGFAASSIGIVGVDGEDPVSRQRFTIAHELMELLVAALKGNYCGGIEERYLKGGKKERLCNWGAARLLMPKASFQSAVERYGSSLRSASKLASLYRTSLLSTLIRLVSILKHPHILVVWRLGYNKEEKKRLAASNQPGLFETNYRATPKKSLRVWYCWKGRSCKYLFIPPNKSVPEESMIAQAATEGFTAGEARLDLGDLDAKCYIQTQKATIGSVRGAISLIRLPKSLSTGRDIHAVSIGGETCG